MRNSRFNFLILFAALITSYLFCPAYAQYNDPGTANSLCLSECRIEHGSATGSICPNANEESGSCKSNQEKVMTKLGCCCCSKD